MSTKIHIVCLDAPTPPDYGGAIDMYYKIKALSGIGKKMILHYFDYNPLRDAVGLEEWCESIFTYKRKPPYQSLPILQPYIIASRINSGLIKRLNEDDHPVLLEGLHCAGIIPYLTTKRRVVVRMHNEEASYYHHLSKTSTSFFKKQYFIQESRLLDSYQTKMDKQIKLACLSETDIGIFENTYNFQKTNFIPCFIPWQTQKNQTGKGSYCLYHGNMLISENEQAAVWLLENVFKKVSVPFIIAGKGISKKLREVAKNYPQVSLIANPSIAEIDNLIQQAHINVLPSMNSTGVKLKLLNALLNGRHCITNLNGIKGSRIKDGVVIKEFGEEWIQAIELLMQKEFTVTEIKGRKKILILYNNQLNAQKLSELW